MCTKFNSLISKDKTPINTFKVNRNEDLWKNMILKQEYIIECIIHKIIKNS